MKVDKVKKKTNPKGDGKSNSKEKQPGKGEVESGKGEGDHKQHTKSLEWFICGDEHYASDCPHHQKFVDSNNKDRTNDKEEEAAVNAVWEANAFVTVRTYQIKVVGLTGFKLTKVLLDNQANISIIRPELLWQVQENNKIIQFNGAME